MEAKDTVMNYELKLCHSLIGKYSLSAIKDVVDEECLAQAEISFKAGIREVVEELEEIDQKAYDTKDFVRRVCDLLVKRQAQLKKWL